VSDGYVKDTWGYHRLSLKWNEMEMDTLVIGRQTRRWHDWDDYWIGIGRTWADFGVCGGRMVDTLLIFNESSTADDLP